MDNVIEKIIEAERIYSKAIDNAENKCSAEVDAFAFEFNAELISSKKRISDNFNQQYLSAVEDMDKNSQIELNEIEGKLNNLYSDKHLCDLIKKRIVSIVFE
jgi:ketopantoate reductase